MAEFRDDILQVPAAIFAFTSRRRSVALTNVSDNEHQRRVVHFRGHVQGVGFRATTQQLAEGFDVQGYVSNMPDGSVLLVVEGRSEELDTFLQAIRLRLGRGIRGESCDVQSANGEFIEFEIR